jgi:UDP-glucuronate decarboxylase
MVDALIRTMNTDDDFTGPVNLGNPGEFTIRELADKILEITDSRSTIDLKELPEDDPTQRCPDITLAREKLGWNPSVELEHGLVETVEWFRENYI